MGEFNETADPIGGLSATRTLTVASRIGPALSPSVYECFPLIWPYNALLGQVATPNLGRVLLGPYHILDPLALVPIAVMVTDDFSGLFTP
jgi:hypothetical protein